MKQPARPWIFRAAMLVLLLAVTSPSFFAIYRTMVFDTIPRDDYARFVLALAGRGGSVPGAPFAYRILSVLPAVQLFRFAPLVVLTNATGRDVDYLRATQAMALLSYLAMVATSLLVHRVARKHLGCSRAASLSALLATYLAFGFTATYGVDAIAIAAIALLLCVVDRPVVFSLLVVPAAFVNEKVPIVFCCVLLARGITSVPRFATGRPQLAAALGSAALYVAVRCIVRIPGNEEQLVPSMYWTNAVATLRENASFRGLELTVLPCLLLIAAFAWGRRAYSADWVHLRPADVTLIPFLLGVALCTGVHLGVGRIVMHAFPFALPLLARALDDQTESQTPAPA